MGERFGIDNLGFLTLTHPDHVVDMKESSKRFNSLATNILRERYHASIVVTERMRSGRVHYHIVAALPGNLAKDFDWTALYAERYREAANDYLRAEWAFWRKACPLYGFGRHELLPIRGTVEGIAKYVGKYVAKHVRQREVRDKGARCVRFIGFGERHFRPQFGWHNGHATVWRMKVAEFARINDCTSMEELKRKFGARWCYKWADAIMHLPLPMPA